MTDHMVEFETPPVHEAVLGIEFSPIALGAVQLAGLLGVWGDEYPVVQEVGALEPSTALGQPEQVLPFRFSTAPPPLRLWFLEPAGNFLVQVQRDRLLLNWRKLENGHYPRYDALRARFEDVLSKFLTYLSSVERAEPLVTATEFTYINRIPGERGAEDVYSVFRTPTRPLPGKPLFTRYQEVRNLGEAEFGSPGQVAITSEPIFENGGSAIQMTVTTKFFPDPLPIGEKVWALLDAGRMTSRDTFVALTTDQMHKEWGAR